jgi:RHS repeat-associated protein
MDGETTYFVGAHYELTGSTVTKYFFAGAARIAMRKYTIPQSMSVEYLLGDHLGSTSLTTDTNGVKVSEMRYKPWGEIRYSWTSAPATTPAYQLPSYTFTGQYSDSYINLLWYNSRHYDPALGRFTSPDTIIPDPSNSQSWDRYAYTFNNPVLYVDPDGHAPCKPGYRCVTPIADERDLTTWVVAAAVDIAESSEMQEIARLNAISKYGGIAGPLVPSGAKALAFSQFKALVEDGAKYDVKDKIEQTIGYDTKIGNGWYEFSTAGNIL